ncbi:MAG TPA: GGDEF domain-containing protein [Pirellulales bacterium]|nr:GGDEF domain-containing protein [Pirellulales bacterium]
MENSSSLVLFAVVMAVVELVAGGAIGWWMRGSQDGAPPGKDGDDVQRARAALSKLHELATSVAADVGEHSSRVQAISSELTNQSEDGPLDSAVLGTVAQIIEANERLQQQLKSAEVKLQEQAHQIEVHAADALTDALTGAPNRRLFDTELSRRLAEWQRKATPFCLLMVDVDHFKKFNDVHGHLAGDEVLRGVAQSLRETLRQMDIVARYGGEEFAVIMPSTTLVESEAGAARTCAYIEGRQFEFEGKALKVAVSGGLAQAQASEDEATLIRRADEALYAAKKAGRNRMYLHDGDSVRPIGGAKAEPQPVETAATSTASPPETAPAAESAGDTLRTDGQTGLPNRTAFCEEVRRRVAESHRYESKLSLMLVKVDNFSRMAGRHGVPAVDLILKTVSQFLTAGMREMDLVARYSDDLFSVLLPGTPLNQAVGVAERLRAAVARCPLRGKDFELRISVSAGLAEVERADDSAAFMKRGEAALQGSVRAGGDCTHFYTGQTIKPFVLKEVTV